MMELGQFMERFRKFERSCGLRSLSYEAWSRSGTPGGWIPKVQVWENQKESSILYEPELKIRNTQEEADSAALWLGLEWLEQHHR